MNGPHDRSSPTDAHSHLPLQPDEVCIDPFVVRTMKTFLIVNPASGGYARQRVVETVDRLQAAGISTTIFSIGSPVEASRCCRSIYSACEQPFVIVAAGDGTINAVLNGLHPRTATIAVLPLGTSNVLAAEIGIGSVQDGVARIIRGFSRPLSIGMMERGQSALRFTLMAGCGLDGAVVRDVRPGEKRVLKQGAYALAAIRNCLSWETGQVEVAMPSGLLTCHSVVVSNVSRYGGDFVLAPQADLFSPGFTVTCVTGSSRRSYAGILFDMARGRASANVELQQVTATEVEIHGAKPIQVDGDFVGYGPARLRVVADFAQIVV